MASIEIKRVYEPRSRDDGERILVDRLWPRGLRKEDAHIDLWEKNIAPTPSLRIWFDHRADRFNEFRRRYREELKSNPAVTQMLEAIGNRKATRDMLPHLIAWQKRNGYPLTFACEATLNIAKQPDILRMLREARFDAVFVHGLWQHPGRTIHLAAREHSIPYFVYPHGMLDPWFRRAYPGKHLKKWLYWQLVERHVLRDATAVMFTGLQIQLSNNPSSQVTVM